MQIMLSLIAGYLLTGLFLLFAETISAPNGYSAPSDRCAKASLTACFTWPRRLLNCATFSFSFAAPVLWVVLSLLASLPLFSVVPGSEAHPLPALRSDVPALLMIAVLCVLVCLLPSHAEPSSGERELEQELRDWPEHQAKAGLLLFRAAMNGDNVSIERLHHELTSEQLEAVARAVQECDDSDARSR